MWAAFLPRAGRDDHRSREARANVSRRTRFRFERLYSVRHASIAHTAAEISSSAALAASPKARAAAVVAVHLIAGAGDGDIDTAAAQVRVAHRLDDALRVRARHLHEGEAVIDVDGADGLAGDARLVRDGTDEVHRADALIAPRADQEARHPRLHA